MRDTSHISVSFPRICCRLGCERSARPRCSGAKMAMAVMDVINERFSIHVELPHSEAVPYFTSSSKLFGMSDVKACVNAVVQNAMTVVEQETGTKSLSVCVLV